MAAMMTGTALGGSVAVFAAGGPGEHLRPIDGAELLVELTQSHESILRSGERRVGEEGRSPGWPAHLKKKK